ncbi:MAG TPA: TIGR03560 family F420-dependent LLM class oxidoreductase [Anaerolineae bacterium]
MATIGIMLEGQEGLTWERLFRLAEAVERLGFESLFRSDHLTSLYGFAERPALALWPSLTALALRTRRIRFGPMVCSITFRHPVIVAKMATAVNLLSNGRLDLGIGAGWYEGEHTMFGIDFPRYSTRLEMLDEGAQVIKALWSGEPTTFHGKHYRLEAAEDHPTPPGNPLTLIMGGKGEKTLKVVARHATEWNFSYGGIELFRQKSSQLDESCREIGRDPAEIRRSAMIPFVIGKDDAAVQDRIDAHRQIFPDLPKTPAEWRAAGFPGGTPPQLTEQLQAFTDAGVQRFMLQYNDLDDLDSLELLAGEVLPHFHGKT